MGKGSLNHPHLSLQEYTLEEVGRHNTKGDRWLVIEGHVYDVTTWCKKHPGGEKVLASYAGEDATEAWKAFHPNQPYVAKFMKAIVIGRVRGYEEKEASKPTLVGDFRKLRKAAEDMGMFKASPVFFFLILAHIILLDLLAWWVMATYGAGIVPFLVASACLTVSQIQAGWAQHDYGHLSVFKNFRLNHWMQIFIINFIKGASAHWWNYRHLNHHAKPNILRKDPDVRLTPLFLVGKALPLEWGKEKKKVLPYNLQHKYFHFVLPPFLLPLYFNYEIPYYLYSRGLWMEMFWMGTFFLRFQLMFAPILGFFQVFGLFLFVRFLESHWFVWSTQMSHLPMTIDYDKADDWVTTQLKATCNIEQSAFNDWFSGHLNFQIEHHLFPTMPRHNYHKVAPMVKSLCKKYGLDYQEKTLFGAFGDIVVSLRESGDSWYEAYTK